jgi:hypothetical protein
MCGNVGILVPEGPQIYLGGAIFSASEASRVCVNVIADGKRKRSGAVNPASKQ